MGMACCTRDQPLKTELVNSVLYHEEVYKGNNMEIANPELKYEIVKMVKTKEDIYLDNLFNHLYQKYKRKIKKITFIELYNLALVYKENQSNSPYIIYDMRRLNEQKEDFLKKMKHINYTYNQLQNLQDKKLENFKKFLNNKIIIFIISEKLFSNDNAKKKKETPIDIVNLFTNYNINFDVCILNSTLNLKESSPLFIKLHELINAKEYEILPYISFCYRHMNTLYIDGFIFMAFNYNKNIFNFENLIKAIKKTNEIPSFENLFLRYMNITTMICIDNNSENAKSFKNMEYQYKNTVYKEFFVSWNDALNKPDNIFTICDWLKVEISKGHSVYINIENFNHKSWDWFLLYVLIMCLVIKVPPEDIIKYLFMKFIYIANFENYTKSYMRSKEEEFFEALCDYGIYAVEKEKNLTDS